jgi:hypothetical protein
VFTSVLMIEKPLNRADVEFLASLHGDDQISFAVLMQPRGSKDRLLRAIDDIALGELEQAVQESGEPEGREALPLAERALEHSVAALRAAGSEAVGEVVQRHPLDALRATVEQTRADEVIVLTAPHFVEEFFHRDWASRARHTVGVPVLRLFPHAPDAKQPENGD